MKNVSDKSWRENRNTFFFLFCRLGDNVEKYCRAEQATDDNMAQAHCMLDTEGYKHTLRTVMLIPFPLQQWLHKRTSTLCYTNTASLVT